MTKSSTFLMSLVAAVPAGLLAFLLVMAFLSHADDMGGTLNAVVGVGLLAAVGTAVMPVGIVLFGGPKGPAKPKPPKKSKTEEPSEEAAAGEESGEVPVEETDDEQLLAEDSADLSEAGSSSELAEFDAAEDDWDETAEGAGDEFEFDDEGLSDDDLDFDFDDEIKS